MQITYDPDNMWHVGHHLLPEMRDRHGQARQKILRSDVDEPALFRGELYERTHTRWLETLDGFRSRLLETEIRIGTLGDAVELAVLNQMRTDQASAGTFDNNVYLEEAMRELEGL